MLRIWEADTGRLVRTLPAPKEPLPDDFVASQVAFSPDGKSLAICDIKTIFICEPTTGRIIHRLNGHEVPGGIFRLAFAANGKVLASASSDDTLRIWNLDTGA